MTMNEISIIDGTINLRYIWNNYFKTENQLFILYIVPIKTNELYAVIEKISDLQPHGFS